MSLPIKNPKILSFSKSDRRVLIKYLEKFYFTKIHTFNFMLKHYPERKKTSTIQMDRRYRLEVKSIEHLLKVLGSDLMANVENTNFRKTTEVNARHVGLLQSIRKTMGD